MPHRRWPALVGLSLLWGLYFILANQIVAAFGWAPAAVLGSLGVALATAVASRIAGRRLTAPTKWGRLAVIGAAVTVQNVGMCLALDRLGVALTAIVMGAMPLFACLIGQVWGIDRITGGAAIGLGVGLVGLLLVVVFPTHGDSWAFISGTLACLLAALAAAFAGRYASERIPERTEGLIAAHLIAALAALPLAIAFGQPPGAPVQGWLALAGFALMVGLAGPVLDVRLPEADLEDRANQVKTGGVLAAALIGTLLLGESLNFGQVLGMLLILAGSAIVLGLLQWPASVGRRS